MSTNRMSLLGRSLLSLALLSGAAPIARAQSVFDSELRLAPQFVQYRIKAPTSETISELAIPVFVTVPFGSRFTFDVGTSYARAQVTNPNAATSEIAGLTDTQLRGNLTLGSDFVVLTAGLNLPTGRSSVTLDQLTAAGRIGNDFLAFPISNMGTGLATTAGIAIARPLGDWNIGVGGSMRHSNAYDPFDVPGQDIRFQPGNEYRARIGVDRPIASGRFSLGVTYSAFGDDAAGSSVYNTGNRTIAQAVYSTLLGGQDLTLAAYDIIRAPGHYASGESAGRENIANGYLGLGLRGLGTIWEPSVEGRAWQQDVFASGSGATATPARSQTSYLGTFGLRTRFEVAGFALLPSAGYTVGRLATVDAASTPVHAEMTGFRAQLAVRVGQ